MRARVCMWGGGGVDRILDLQIEAVQTTMMPLK